MERDVTEALKNGVNPPPRSPEDDDATAEAAMDGEPPDIYDPADPNKAGRGLPSVEGKENLDDEQMKELEGKIMPEVAKVGIDDDAQTKLKEEIGKFVVGTEEELNVAPFNTTVNGSDANIVFKLTKKKEADEKYHVAWDLKVAGILF